MSVLDYVSAPSDSLCEDCLLLQHCCSPASQTRRLPEPTEREPAWRASYPPQGGQWQYPLHEDLDGWMLLTRTSTPAFQGVHVAPNGSCKIEMVGAQRWDFDWEVTAYNWSIWEDTCFILCICNSLNSVLNPQLLSSFPVEESLLFPIYVIPTE